MKKVVLALGCLAYGLCGALSIGGCGSGDQIQKEDPAVAKSRLDAGTNLRSYFDKSNGNYDALSAEDKAAVDKITGSEANSRTAFGHMIPGTKPAGAPGGAPAPAAGGGRPATGPNTVPGK